MATDKQIAANRQNAKYSTGPRTAYGKRRSRRNAIRHGLTAETAIDVHEDRAAYKALERAINADYRPRTNFELELVARLVSLLWRLRRAVAIESGLLDIQAKHLHGRTAHNHTLENDKLSIFYNLIPSLTPAGQTRFDYQSEKPNDDIESSRQNHATKPKIFPAGIARSFLNIANRDSGVFDRLGRYEMSLWRQTAQTILLLNAITHDAYDQYADGARKSLHLTRRHRRILWPPFRVAASTPEE